MLARWAHRHGITGTGVDISSAHARRTHLAYQRRYMGWGVFVLRAAGPVRQVRS